MWFYPPSSLGDFTLSNPEADSHPSDLNARQLVVDVRMPSEYATAHIPGSINIPLPEVANHISSLTSLDVDKILLVCQSGQRATSCHKTFDGSNVTVEVYEGGLSAWQATGGAVIEGRQKWSLERQVRLAAGSIVLTSIIASTKIPKAKYVAGFIGAGLTFAAVSNTCGMAAALSRLPYNQEPEALSPAESLDEAKKQYGTRTN